MNKSIPIQIILLSAIAILALIRFSVPEGARQGKLTIGQRIDSLNGVYVYHNGSIGNVSGRNYTSTGYNLGLKYQCVEFVKRYYYQYYGHRMPNSYGHAKEFYDRFVKDGGNNQKRDLLQFTNPSISAPTEGDLLVFDATPYNQYGHVAIISKVFKSRIEIIQQNSGSNPRTRASYDLTIVNGRWKIKNDQVLGWLRKTTPL